MMDAEKEKCLDVKDKAEEEECLSKRALKKLQKRKAWLESKGERRAKEKAKRKEKMAKRKLEHDYDASYSESRKRLKKSQAEKTSCGIKVAFDMSFDHLMNQRDRGKCLKQLMHCYSINRRLPKPLILHATSFMGRVEEEMGRHDGFQNWDLSFHADKYTDVFDAKDIVYLSSESEHVVGDSLDPSKIYMIGGFVDHNLHKGLCHKLACEAGVGHARLPIDEHIELKTRKVLTIDHVFQIMASVASNGKTWREAFLDILPARKGAQSKQD